MALTQVHNRMIDQNIFDVVDFGADPTGVADSRSAINSAFAACTSLTVADNFNPVASENEGVTTFKTLSEIQLEIAP